MRFGLANKLHEILSQSSDCFLRREELRHGCVKQIFVAAASSPPVGATMIS